MIYFTCTVCQTALSADEQFGGKSMRCPTCLSTQTVPAAERVAVGGGSAAPVAVSSLKPPQPRPPVVPPRGDRGRRYGFNCPYCSSRLEANEGAAGNDGQCPTCGSAVTIPILDRYGRLIDPKTNKIIKQDPHPVHAYAAAGERAPKIIRLSDGGQQIQCARCSAYSSIASNNCRQCGMPFTMEGTTAEAPGSSNGYCVASLVLGLIGLPAFCTLIVPGLAILFGIVGYNAAVKKGEKSGRGLAIAGIICGAIGGVMGLWSVLKL